MTGDEIGATAFPVRARGYNRLAVHLELARIVDLQKKGFAPSRYGFGPDSRNLLARGYDPDVVDRFFADMAREAPPDLRVLPEIADHGGGDRPARATDWEAEWRRVADLPGVRLHATTDKVMRSAGEVLLTAAWDSFSGPSLTPATLTQATGQMLRIDTDDVSDGPATRPGWQVTDPLSGEPVLWIRGSHSYRSAGGYILLPRRRFLVFPVTGTRHRNAVMTAVTESAGTALTFRRIGTVRFRATTTRGNEWALVATAKHEVVVSPDHELTTELMCIVCLAAGWLGTYFESPTS